MKLISESRPALSPIPPLAPEFCVPVVHTTVVVGRCLPVAARNMARLGLIGSLFVRPEAWIPCCARCTERWIRVCAPLLTVSAMAGRTQQVAIARRRLGCLLLCRAVAECTTDTTTPFSTVQRCTLAYNGRCYQFQVQGSFTSGQNRFCGRSTLG